MIYSLDDEILIDACWAISYLSDGSNDKIQAVIESGVCRRLVDLLMHTSTTVQTPALRSVGNIVTGDDMQTQVVIASGALPALLSLLSSPKDGIRKEACWTISNVTAGSPPQIQAVIDANIIPPLINILQNADFKTRKEACWAISNATSGGLQEPSQIRYLVTQGCIKPLCDLLTMMDNKIIQVALDGLDNILKVGEMDKSAQGPGAVNQYAMYVEEAGGMVTIHNLQQHDNMEIYRKAYNIMDKYFPDDEEVDAGISAPTVDASGAFAVCFALYKVLHPLINPRVVQPRWCRGTCWRFQLWSVRATLNCIHRYYFTSFSLPILPSRCRRPLSCLRKLSPNHHCKTEPLIHFLLFALWSMVRFLLVLLRPLPSETVHIYLAFYHALLCLRRFFHASFT